MHVTAALCWIQLNGLQKILLCFCFLSLREKERERMGKKEGERKGQRKIYYIVRADSKTVLMKISTNPQILPGVANEGKPQ